jgi:predicted  nucleic acid-binding Zn-ribbon protein
MGAAASKTAESVKSEAGKADVNKRVAEQSSTTRKKGARLSPAEKVAKAEADLKAARELLESKAKGEVTKIEDELKKVRGKRDELNTKLTDLETRLASAKANAGQAVEG